MPPPTSGTALPTVKSLQDCADYHQVFEPYLPQLYTLPDRIFATLSDVDGLKDIYTSTNPAISGLAFAIALMPVFLLVSEINRNFSQVDRVWSLLPTVYHAHYALWARMNGMDTQKVDNVLAFSVVWSLRLTFNYWRKGGYEIGSEDYRWNIIKDKIGAFGLFILNIVFISSVQSVLLWAVTAPAYILLLSTRLSPSMQTPDYVISRAMIGLVILEFFADNQMWNFQQAKKQYQKTAQVPKGSGFTRAQLDRGFITTGLWRFSRHPNFAAEQAIWLCLYAWGCVASETYFNWSVAGVAGYMLVFAGSTPLTERISAGKYPDYKVYQQRVGRFIPSLFFGKSWDEAEMERSSKVNGGKR
ncbi:DUF1295-domain-containing protein [Hortaea werneckii]|nr:DUF1295-domain-containing protein [Hortaea werneckii]KAI7099320.1 DUF1295-domain-containing protein [Hortaea werneckii]KAI7237292.1 DUF1295-domain-containing protein [Hortaea werneckii]KAI7319962.1 DUF1295-domain-containing protein [Hortaea werneckii]KAI7363049.1 DUF1295-domain-containing protein [Hortaea werneckii]